MFMELFEYATSLEDTGSFAIARAIKTLLVEREQLRAAVRNVILKAVDDGAVRRLMGGGG